MFGKIALCFFLNILSFFERITMKIASFEMSAGAAGDMIVAALLNAGLPFEILEKIFKELPIEGVELTSSSVVRNSIKVNTFNVACPEVDSERHLSEIVEIIKQLPLTERVCQLSIAAFNLLAESEAKMHGIPVDHVHFHEVGAVDSIVDIVAAMAGLDWFGVEKIYIDSIPWPSGVITCRHGVIPNPAPATTHLLRDFPHRPVTQTVEMVTPTAATILRLLGNPREEISLFHPEHIGMGAGTRIIEGTTGYLRIMIGEKS
jgi:hypothetical protein